MRTDRPTPATLAALLLAGSAILYACIADPAFMDPDGGDTEDGECPEGGGGPRPDWCPELDGITAVGECVKGHRRDDGGNCVCRCGFTDDDGWCVYTGCGGGGGGGGGGGEEEEEEDDTVTFKVKLKCQTTGVRGGTVSCDANPKNTKGQDVT